ncbi:MAG TPA: hypothetical protein VKG23_14055 [Thermoanaerobaculia bacterium]|nr:hypothetical protein [Thermoanaerobaculia bacterium]
MIRVALFLFVVFMLLTVIRGLRIFLRAFLESTRRPTPRAEAAREAEMVRDPVCGTWLDRGLALTGEKEGRAVSVCSEECRRELERTG